MERRESSIAKGMLGTEGICMARLWRMGSCTADLGGPEMVGLRVRRCSKIEGLGPGVVERTQPWRFGSGLKEVTRHGDAPKEKECW